MHTYIHTCTHTYTHTYIHTYIHTCTHTYTHISATNEITKACVCMHVCTHAKYKKHTYKYTYLHTYLSDLTYGCASASRSVMRVLVSKRSMPSWGEQNVREAFPNVCIQIQSQRETFICIKTQHALLANKTSEKRFQTRAKRFVQTFDVYWHQHVLLTNVIETFPNACQTFDVYWHQHVILTNVKETFPNACQTFAFKHKANVKRSFVSKRSMPSWQKDYQNTESIAC